MSFYSPYWDFSVELAYKNNMVYFSAPKLEISSRTPYYRLSSYGKKYWLYFKITTTNILFLLFILLFWRIIKKGVEYLKPQADL